VEEITVQDALASFGLSQKETKIYLATLELGTATANKIAEKSCINRSTTYDILKSFLEQGIASKVIIENTAYFEVAGPEKLISLLEEKKEKIKQVISQLKIIREKTVIRPSVQVYQGKDGFKTVLDDILESRKEVKVISTSKIFDIMKYYFPHFIKRRAELGIKTLVIQEQSSQTMELKKHDKGQLRQTKTIENWNVNSMTFIYDTKIAIIKLVEDEIIAVLINDSTLNEDYQKIFQVLWKSAN
jgi:sugar-specific transcriptional regulator TrmB